MPIAPPVNSCRMGEFDDFHRDFLPRFIEAQRVFHGGNPEPNITLWSVTDPVTLLAARGMCESGTQPVTATFRRVAAWFSDVQDYDWETVASGVSGDMAYTVCIERYTASVEGAPATRAELRSTHVFRRENGRWLAIHRHADRRPPDAPVE